MASTISEYLTEVETQLRGAISDHALQTVLAETENHLRESALEIESLGFTALEAEQHSVANFGESRDYGRSLTKVETPRVWAAPKKLVLAAACFSMLPVLGWTAFVRDIPWYHVDETIRMLRPYLVPSLFVLFAAALGSRVRARSLYLLALAGGIILVPVMAARFVGSGFSGGLVVRSVQPRWTAVDGPGWMRTSGQAYKATGERFDRMAAEVAKAGVPHYTTSHGNVYVAPGSHDKGSIERRPDEFLLLASKDAATQAWKTNAATDRYYIGVGEGYADMAARAQERLDEPYWYRAFTMSTWALLFAGIWGTMLLALQLLGSAIRVVLVRLILLLVGEAERPLVG